MFAVGHWSYLPPYSSQDRPQPGLIMPHRRIEMPPSTPAYTGRGVYEQSYVGAGGERYLVAIDHRGRRVAEATLLPGISSPAAVTALLRQILDRVDPGYLRIIS